jgi:nicotinamide-nucleotide amidase
MPQRTLSAVARLIKAIPKKCPPTLYRASAGGGGETGIRTLGTVARTSVFETDPFNRSGISPGAANLRSFDKIIGTNSNQSRSGCGSWPGQLRWHSFLYLHPKAARMDKILEQIKKYLEKKGETISVAESVTSGWLQVLLSRVPGAEQFYQGGITTYNIGQKCRHLLVEPIHAKECNCVSSKVAEQMALEVCHLFQSQWGVSVTGYATPVPESGNKIFCHFAICHNKKVIESGVINGNNLGPGESQEKFAETVFKKLSRVMNDIK